MIPTHGLSHVALAVQDPEVSLQFYAKLFGVKEYFRDANVIQVIGPGDYDVIAFEKAAAPRAKGAIDHVGFRLTDPMHIALAIAEAQAIGATIVSQGEHSPGFPYLNILDPDGIQIEIWFE
ncbi:MAG: VOC family protein [Pseudomonadales bacterium]